MKGWAHICGSPLAKRWGGLCKYRNVLVAADWPSSFREVELLLLLHQHHTSHNVAALEPAPGGKVKSPECAKDC